MGVPVLLGAGSQRDVSTSQRLIECRVPVAAQHPAAVNRLTLCSNAANGFVRIVRTGQRIMVDQGHIHPRSAGGIRLSGEILIDAGRVYYVGWHEENHKRSLPPHSSRLQPVSVPAKVSGATTASRVGNACTIAPGHPYCAHRHLSALAICSKPCRRQAKIAASPTATALLDSGQFGFDELALIGHYEALGDTDAVHRLNRSTPAGFAIEVKRILAERAAGRVRMAASLLYAGHGFGSWTASPTPAAPTPRSFPDRISLPLPTFHHRRYRTRREVDQKPTGTATPRGPDHWRLSVPAGGLGAHSRYGPATTNPHRIIKPTHTLTPTTTLTSTRAPTPRNTLHLLSHFHPHHRAPPQSHLLHPRSLSGLSA